MFEIVYRRLVTRLGHNQTIGAIAHRLCRLIWIILHRGVRYEERGPSVSTNARRQRTTRMIRELRNLGYRVEPVGTAACRVQYTSLFPLDFFVSGAHTLAELPLRRAVSFRLEAQHPLRRTVLFPDRTLGPKTN